MSGATMKPRATLTPSEELTLVVGGTVPRWGGFNGEGELLYVERLRREVIARFEYDHWRGYWRQCRKQGCAIRRVTLTQGNVDATTREVKS